jgi:hypothetical protein
MRWQKNNANQSLTKKYGFLKRVYDVFHQVTGSKRKYLEISLSAES